MSKLDPVLNYDEWLKQARKENDLNRNQQEFWKNTIFTDTKPKEITAKSVDEFCRRLIHEQRDSDALKYHQANVLRQWVRRKMNENEWTDLRLPEAPAEGIPVEFDTEDTSYTGRFKDGIFYTDTGYLVHALSVKRWRYGAKVLDNYRSITCPDCGKLYNDHVCRGVPLSVLSEKNYNHLKDKYTWKRIVLDDPPMCPVLVRYHDEAIPFIASEIIAGMDHWEYCEIPE